MSGERKQEMSTGESVKQVSQRGADSSVASGRKIWDLFMGKTKRGCQTYDQHEINGSCNNVNSY